MDISIFTIFSSLIFTLVWGFALMGLIDSLAPLVRRLKKCSQDQKRQYYPYSLFPKT